MKNNTTLSIPAFDIPVAETISSIAANDDITSSDRKANGYYADKNAPAFNPADHPPAEFLNLTPPPVIDDLPPLELEREQIPADAKARLEKIMTKPKRVATAKSVDTNKIQSVQNDTQNESVPLDDLPPNFNARARAWIDVYSELPSANLFKVMSFKELMAKEYVDKWVIEGLIEPESVGMIFGNSASGKSLIVQDACVCVAAGIDFHGKPTKKMKVIYIAGEGARGLQKRNAAICEKYGIDNYDDLDRNLFISEAPAAFLGEGDKGWVAIANTIEALRHDGGGDVGLIVIDTLHRNFGDGDENSSKDFAEFMKYIDIIKLASGAAILLIHHSGNEAKDRARGSSSMRASMDWEFSVSKKDDTVTMSNTKMKDHDTPKPMSFEVTKLLDSVVLESTDYVAKKTAKSLTQNSSKSLESLHETIAENGISPPDIILKHFNGSPQNLPKKVVTIEQWRIFAYSAITVDSDGDTAAIQKAKRTAFLRSRGELQKAGSVGIHGDFAWIVQAEIRIDFSAFKVK